MKSESCIQLDETVEVAEENRHWQEPDIPNIAPIEPNKFDVFRGQPPDPKSNP
jgi:hypothetical protein